MPDHRHSPALVLCAACLALAGPASADELRLGTRLLLTRGVSSLEGAAGGGLATWALIAGDETDAGVGGTVHGTFVDTGDYRLTAVGAAVGLFDRVELSVARQRFDTRDVGAALGLGRGFTFTQDVYGVKIRVLGDAVYDQDRWWPQVAVGAQYKTNDRGPIIAAVGGRDDEGVDYYVSATKVLLAQQLVLSGAVRWTRANQTGLLGFGGDREDGYTAQFEGSAGYLVSRRLLVGVEYRTKPDNLGFAREDDAFDVFAAYAISRHVSVTAAYVDLGDIATMRNQRGVYVSLQGGF